MASCGAAKYNNRARNALYVIIDTNAPRPAARRRAGPHTGATAHAGVPARHRSRARTAHPPQQPAATARRVRIHAGRARRHRQMEIARADRIADASRLSAPLPYALLTRRQRPSTHDTLHHPPVSGVCGSLVSRRRAHKPPSRTAATPLTSHVHARHAHTAHVHTRDVHQRPDAPITLQPENRHAHVPTYPSLECMPYARKLGSK